MTHTRSRWLSVGAYAALALAGASVSSARDVHVRVHVRVHSTRVSSSSDASPLVCPLGDDLDVPSVLLPCPYACGSDTALRACVLFPAASQAFCAGDCVYGDTCAIQCINPPIDEQWTLRVSADNTSDAMVCSDEGNASSVLRVDGSMVRGLKILDGVALPTQLREIAIDGAFKDTKDDAALDAASSFSVPANFFDRVGGQVTFVSLENVVLAEQVWTTQSSFPVLKKLRITRSGLDECPFDASQMPNTSFLDLSDNKLRSFNGSGFDSLTELYLGHNQIAAMPLGSLPLSLRVLNLSNNALTAFPGGIQALKSLRNLTLDNNVIQSVPTEAFSSTSVITELSLRNASLTAIPTTLDRLKKLSILRLDHNDLSKSTNSSFARLPRSLTQLSLNDANLQRFPSGLKSHTNLSSLSLAFNSFENGTIDCSSLPRQLRSLNLSSSRLRLVPTGFENLSSLAFLDLSGNTFAAGADASKMPPSLTYINLDNCGLKEIPRKLAKIPKLQILSLRSNPISDTFSTEEIPTVDTLLLDGTSISSLNSFPTSSSLETLSCRNCSKLVSLAPLPRSLKKITLSHVAMTSIAKGVFPATLQSLSLTDVEKLSTVPEDVFSMTKLVHLNLSRCNLANFTNHNSLLAVEELSIENNTLVSFSATLPRVKTLDLKGNRLQLFDVINATELVHLDISDNSFDQVPQAVFQLHALQSLRLKGNAIRDYQPTTDELAVLMKITHLEMEQQQFSTDCTTSTQLKQFTVCVSGTTAGPPTAASNDTPSLSATKKSSSGITIAMDILLVLGLVLAMAFIWRRDVKERRKRRHNEKEAIYAARSAEMSPSMAHVDVNCLAPYRLERDSLFKSRRIGAGAYGEVWLAIYGSQRVAIKQLKHEEATPDAVQRFTQEAKLVSDLNHPSVVAFVGVVWTELTDLALVTVFAENGNLRDHLARVEPPSSGQWDASKVKIALDIAEALAYLHSLGRPVIHRDLQSRNVLLDDRFSAKVAGFGVAVRGRSGSIRALAGEKLVERVGSVRWLAPELITGSHFTPSVDIFSLGVILSELDTHELPYASVQGEDGEPIGDDAVKTRVADGTLRLALSPTCPRAIAELALRCGAFEPSDRPLAADVANQLQMIHSTLVAEQVETGVSL